MKSRLDYRTKRIVIIAIIAVILFAIASISTFFFIKGNDKTQAAELDSMTASEQKNTQEQKNEEGTTQTTVPSGDTQSEQTSEEQTNDTTEVATTQTTPAMQIENDGTNGTQTTNANVGLQENTTTRTETQLVENKTVLLGFNQEDINVDINAVSNLSSNLPQIDKEITASNLNGILSGAEITYEIKITNQNAEIVNQLNVSALIPEGTELVADSISDNGICENGKISWKVDVNTEKTVKFTVKVIAEEGVISANAVVEGKETETIQTPILKATLTVDKTEVSKNETLTYTVSVENTANIPAEIKVEATIPENTQLETEGLDVTDKTINWNKTLEALEKVEYSYTVKVNKYEKDYVIENVVKVNEAETNKVSTTIVDKIPPQITVKDGYIGDKDRNIFSNVSFKLYDENGVVAYKINDGEYTTFTVNNWSDANFNN
ncbi:MAG: Ig-like domain-containing protein, partial [Clostridia bacterium]